MACVDWGSDLCTGGTPSTNCSFETWVIANAFDNDTGTSWIASGCGASIPYGQYWKSGGITAEKCRAYGVGGNLGANFELRGSNTGLSWSDVLCTLTPNAGWQEHEFSKLTYSHWRWTCDQLVGAGESASIYELELYLCADALPIKVNIADVFKDAKEIKINIGDVWKPVTEIKINIGDVWKTIF